MPMPELQVCMRNGDGGSTFYQKVIPAVGGGFVILQERVRDFASRISKRVFDTEEHAIEVMNHGSARFGDWDK